MTAHPASDGWRWVLQGIQLYRRNPGELFSLTLAYITVVLLINVIPLIGSVAGLLLAPSCCLAMMQACRQVSRGQSVWSPELLAGVQMPALPGQLRLGMVSVCGTIVASLAAAGVFYLLDDQASWQVMSGQVAPGKGKIDAMNLFIVSACAAAVYFPFMAALWFAPALASWHKMPTRKAIFYSFFALWRSGRAFIIYGLGLIGLFFAGIFFASLISVPLVHLFGNQQLISYSVALALLLNIIAIFYCTLYCTYENVFGADQKALLP